MFKKISSRNQRSKGIRIKHVLQICLLLGVCFWLIYQVKRSHDKRKEFDAKDAKVSVKEQADDLILKFGRKDLPHVQEASKNFKHEEEEEEENVIEDENKHDEEQEEKTKRQEAEEHEGAKKHVEEERVEGSKHEEEEKEEGSKHEEEEEEETNKHEEDEEAEEVRSKHEDEEQEAEIKDEEAEDEGKVVGDDEVDENEQERADAEVGNEEELMDEEKEREAEGDDKENEEKEGHEGNEESANDQNVDGGDRDTHEAREEQYKGDDASSAVSHDTQITTSETDKLEMENPNDNLTTNVLEQESKANATEKTDGDENKSEGKQSEGGSSSTGDENKSDLKADEGKHSETGSYLNTTDSKANDHDTGSSNSEHISLQNTTDTTELIVQASNNTTEESKETNNEAAKEIPGSLQNGTSALDTTGGGRVIEEIYKEKAKETVVDASKIENVVDDTPRINVTTEGIGFESSTNKETTDNEKQEGDNESDGKDENEDTSSYNETVDGNHNDPIDTSDNSVSQEEKGTEIDLSTLPDTTTEGANNEDSVAE
ncbi:hypothetical protein ERO13_A03G213300v2 [Gossypium hirsutum]|uniref:Spore wall protein 2-like n=1 Tax=Gossypium hirsutum TaxID=3635 RepID=A0A1U8ML88_GOSHI|nr:cilia- and flagella-associated protein 251 [Gossypium hirsutum]XP_016727601.1 cilia- and flagella-associated protein 251 [Gossypium hirsutum]KAG4209635.1 hypothetical protein ERO13_A03G213300v2 [Gossypium hirsutum]